MNQGKHSYLLLFFIAVGVGFLAVVGAVLAGATA